MKHLLFFSLSSIFVLQSNNQFAYLKKPTISPDCLSNIGNNQQPSQIKVPDEPGRRRISSVVFKNQQFCRAEVPDFEFDARFTIVSATVYFSGANFKNVERGIITNSSLKPVAHLMDRCLPGSVVVFDDIKVIGPDKMLRTIEAVSFLLY